MPGAPAGTVTFLFNDVEGCTTRWESSAEAVEVALARYEKILKEILKAHRVTLQDGMEGFLLRFRSHY